MTCIAGIAHMGKVYIGGDSAGVSGMDIIARADQKVFTNGEFIFGFTTSFRMGQLIRYAFEPPKRHPDQDLMEYMVIDFVNSLRYVLTEGAMASNNDGVETAGTFLVGHQGRLFTIDADYQVGESLMGYDSVGCGSQIALGSLFSTDKMKKTMKPTDRIEMALQAAEAFSAGVIGPFTILDI